MTPKLDFRSSPESGLKSVNRPFPFRAKSGSRPFSFDHLVGAPHQIERDGNTKGLRSLEVDDSDR